MSDVPAHTDPDGGPASQYRFWLLLVNEMPDVPTLAAVVLAEIPPEGRPTVHVFTEPTQAGSRFLDNICGPSESEWSSSRDCAEDQVARWIGRGVEGGAVDGRSLAEACGWLSLVVLPTVYLTDAVPVPETVYARLLAWREDFQGGRLTI